MIKYSAFMVDVLVVYSQRDSTKQKPKTAPITTMGVKKKKDKKQII